MRSIRIVVIFEVRDAYLFSFISVLLGAKSWVKTNVGLFDFPDFEGIILLDEDDRSA